MINDIDTRPFINELGLFVFRKFDNWQGFRPAEGVDIIHPDRQRLFDHAIEISKYNHATMYALHDIYSDHDLYQFTISD